MIGMGPCKGGIQVKRLWRSTRWMVLLALLSCCGSCDGLAQLFLNQTASLGGQSAVQPGTIGVLFINNTPYRAVFTAGSFDQMNQFTQPDIEQFGSADDEFPLAGDSQTSILDFRCARVFSIGSPALRQLIEENLPDVDLVESALVEGVEFFAVQGEALEDETLVSKGFAPAREVLLGVDFPCNGLLIFRFEFDDIGDSPFRIDFQVIPSESTR